MLCSRRALSLAWTLSLSLTACGDTDTEGYPDLDGAETCLTPLVPNEPLCNVAFADEAWPASHRNSYAQGSAAAAGPGTGATVSAEHMELPGAPIILSFSAPYEDGGRAVWGTVLGLQAAVIKVDHDSFELIDSYVPAEREQDPPNIPLGVSGAYTTVDRQNRFIVGRTRFVSIFGDSIEGDRASPIGLQKRIFMPNELFCGPDDVIAGMSLTFDGQLAFATERGNLFVIPADATTESLANVSVPVVSTNDNCLDEEPNGLEIVSNSIATDENGGIYMVTSRAMYRFDWNGTGLSLAWRAEYETEEEPVSPIRLGPGSGSTPSLMGTAAEDDRFVVITDGQSLMHLVLFWRDEVPADWTPIAPGKDRRIACEIPVRFGDENAQVSISEQSVAVRGYGAVLVNNLITDPTQVSPGFEAIGQNLLSALEAGVPAKAPFGLERIDWNPVTRTCESVWANSEISVPNGIPSISETTGLVYGMGQRDGQWGLEGLRFETGESVLWAPGGPGTCDEALIAPSLLVPEVADVLAQVPNSCENSLYAATTVAPGGQIWTGTFFGMSRYVPDSVETLSAAEQVAAGFEQSLDLLNRVETEPSPGALGTAELLQRALVQLDASIAAADSAALEDQAAAARSARDSVESALLAYDAGQSFTEHTAAARAALTDGLG